MGKIVLINFDLTEDFNRWQDFIYSRDDTHCTDLAQWRLFFKELYGIQNFSYAYVENNQFLGVISLYLIRSPFMGKMLISSPFFGYGGLYSDKNEVQEVLSQKIENVAQKFKVDFIEIRLRKILPPPFKVNTDFLEYDLNLLDTPEKVWEKQLSSNVRQNIRKSGNYKLEFSPSSHFRLCYKLLSHTIRDLGTPFHSIKFFKLINKYLKNDVFFSTIKYHNKVVAGGIVIKFKNSISTPYIGSIKKYRNMMTNYFLYWKLIKHCFKLNVKRFEFGRSPKGSTHIHFKKKWGGEEIPIFYNYKILNPKKKYKSVSNPSKIFLFATQIWKRIPLSFTRFLGKYLFRYVP